MAWRDILRTLLGRKTEAEKEAEEKFERALREHQASDGQVVELRERLHDARKQVHDRLVVISKESSSHVSTP